MGNCNNKQTQRTFVDPNSISHTDLERLSKGKPINISEGLKVKLNSHTNRLEGVPKEWAKKYKLPIEIDSQKIADYGHLPPQTRPSSQLPQTIIDFIESKQSQKRQESKISISQGSCASSASTKLSKELKAKYGISNIPQNLLQEIYLSQISDRQISQPNNLIDIITIEDQPIFESKSQNKLLTTNEFQLNLSKLKIIQQNPAEKYNFDQKQIGKSAMCQVYKAFSKLNERIVYAVKIIKLDQSRTLQKIKEQIAAMQMCYSSNIIDYHFTYLYKQSLFMFMQYMDYGSLTRFIKYYFDKGKKIPEGVVWYILYEILKGLACIHSRWQIHRDLKSDNILLTKKGEVKISDFGYALQFTKKKTSSRDVVGTPAWMAPELIMKKDYNQSIDIWSLGIIITELVNGQPQYLRLKPLKAMYMIVSEDPPKVENISSELKDFTSKCLQKEPQKRASIKQLLNYPYLKNMKSLQKQKQEFKMMLTKSISS